MPSSSASRKTCRTAPIASRVRERRPAVIAFTQHIRCTSGSSSPAAIADTVRSGPRTLIRHAGRHCSCRNTSGIWRPSHPVRRRSSEIGLARHDRLQPWTAFRCRPCDMRDPCFNERKNGRKPVMLVESENEEDQLTRQLLRRRRRSPAVRLLCGSPWGSGTSCMAILGATGMHAVRTATRRATPRPSGAPPWPRRRSLSPIKLRWFRMADWWRRLFRLENFGGVDAGGSPRR